MRFFITIVEFVRRIFHRIFRPGGMDRVHSQQERPVSEVEFAAIAIRSITPTQRHIGVLHCRGDSSPTLMLHLAWHQDVRNHEPGNDYLWIAPAIPARRLRQVAARCRQLWRANRRGIPYAFSPPNACFDERTGEYLFGPTQHGLTCASFVLAVFQVAGLRLVDEDSWPTSRAGDREWQESILGALENSSPPASQEHLEAVRSELGSVRIRPEEVAGSGTVSPLPASFRIAEERATQILRRLG